jgi:DNA-binding transcriptional LysR family regulator
MRRLLDPVLLRSFIAVAEMKSFTLAARQIGLSQSTVSQHITRLEQQIGRNLLARDTHSVTPTPDGDALLPFARRAIEANERIDGYFTGSDLRGVIRFGAAEEFVYSALPDILAEFIDAHREVDLELTVGLSAALYEKYDAGDLDLIFTKRRSGDERGQVAWSESLIWIGRPDRPLAHDVPLPLVLFPPPSITRSQALAALENAGRSWRVACTSGSLSGIRAAAMAGLGIAAHSPRLIPPGLAALPASAHLPKLGQIDFVVIGPGKHQKPAMALAATILSSANRIRAVAS